LQPARAAMQEPAAEFALQRLQAPGHGGGGQAEPFGRGSQAAGLDDRHEQGQGVEHGGSLNCQLRNYRLTKEVYFRSARESRLRGVPSTEYSQCPTSNASASFSPP